MILNWLSSKKNQAKQIKTPNSNHFVLGGSFNIEPKANESEIYFGCGCFWGAEKGFWKLPGVVTTAVGYAGGVINNPSYKDVCTGKTEHAEVVRVIWNENEIDISDLLKLFWECHDPTQGDRQGNDHGSQYRSAIFSTSMKHLQKALSSREAYQQLLTKNGFGSITTQIEGEFKFFYAEGYHQQYLAKPGSRPYCSAMPTNISLDSFNEANFKLNSKIWENFDWKQVHCVLRSSNEPIPK